MNQNKKVIDSLREARAIIDNEILGEQVNEDGSFEQFANPAASAIAEIDQALAALEEKPEAGDGESALCPHEEYYVCTQLKQLQEAVIDLYISQLGLEKCEFDDECDSCQQPEGGTWASMSYSDVAEANYYICGKCIFEQALTKEKPCEKTNWAEHCDDKGELAKRVQGEGGGGGANDK